MIIYSIYKATNKINGKCYIGFDSKWPKRKKQHEYNSFNKWGIQYNYKFHNAIRKYGKDAFEWEVIYQALDRDYCLNEAETFFIKEYNSFGENGYNMTEGSEGGLKNKGRPFPHSEESKQKMSLKAKETWAKNPRTNSLETREKLSKALKGRKQSEEHRKNRAKAQIGRVQTETTKQKISEAKKGRKMPEARRLKLIGKIPWNKGKKFT